MSTDQIKRLYVRGINKNTFKADIISHFNVCGAVLKVEFDDVNRTGYCYVEFITQEGADVAAIQMHQSKLNGTSLDVRFDHNRPRTRTNYSVEKSIKTTDAAVCRMCRGSSEGRGDKNKDRLGQYSTTGLTVGGVEYPMPQGRYLIKLLRLCHSSLAVARQKPLLDLLTAPLHGNRHNKELTESMAMCDAVFRAGHLTNSHWESLPNVNVYVVADGKVPYTLTACALLLPEAWQLTAIDPLLDFDAQALGEHAARCHIVPSMSQDYVVRDYCQEFISRQSGVKQGQDGETSAAVSTERVASHSIVIACHSHAPLQEFWDRVPCPKHAVVMPCCGKDWSNLSLSPLDTFDDYEVYSPKRKIFLYYQKQ